uniref:Uncharacterized protein n=1 Tax=Panstrongylus lignarius TaxID=156445 RepID=A0A224XTQ5_9HEMI
MLILSPMLKILWVNCSFIPNTLTHNSFILFSLSVLEPAEIPLKTKFLFLLFFIILQISLYKIVLTFQTSDSFF